MISISICMIVKNEEKVLRRCLDSLAGLAEELIIVDTGSSDRTKEIAAEYTGKIYDFTWTGDFSQARNFAFSKATREYIYSADADEVLEEDNRRKFLKLKESLLPEVEIVQMKYGNQLQHNTIYNFDEEYRPKLFKRVRSFVWVEPIHETVRTKPVIYDSDIVITHLPQSVHAKRDFRAFETCVDKGLCLSERLFDIYARELFISGTEEDFFAAAPFFEASAADTERSGEEFSEACLVAARAARHKKDIQKFFKYIMKVTAAAECSEACYELGEYYLSCNDFEEAAIWFYNARYETAPILNVQLGGILALEKLAACYDLMGNTAQADLYRLEAGKAVSGKESE